MVALVKFHAFTGAFIGLLLGIIYSFGGIIVDLQRFGSLNWGTLLAFLSLIGMPILFALFGVFLAMIQAIIFNYVAPKFRGINIDFNANY